MCQCTRLAKCSRSMTPPSESDSTTPQSIDLPTHSSDRNRCRKNVSHVSPVFSLMQPPFANRQTDPLTQKQYKCLIQSSKNDRRCSHAHMPSMFNVQCVRCFLTCHAPNRQCINRKQAEPPILLSPPNIHAQTMTHCPSKRKQKQHDVNRV